MCFTERPTIFMNASLFKNSCYIGIFPLEISFTFAFAVRTFHIIGIASQRFRITFIVYNSWFTYVVFSSIFIKARTILIRAFKIFCCITLINFASSIYRKGWFASSIVLIKTRFTTTIRLFTFRIYWLKNLRNIKIFLQIINLLGRGFVTHIAYNFHQ